MIFQRLFDDFHRFVDDLLDDFSCHVAACSIAGMCQGMRSLLGAVLGVGRGLLEFEKTCEKCVLAVYEAPCAHKADTCMHHTCHFVHARWHFQVLLHWFSFHLLSCNPNV